MYQYNPQDQVNIFRYVLVDGRPEREKYTFIRPEACGRKSNDPLAFKIENLPGEWVMESFENAYIKVEKKNTGGIWYGNPFEFPLEDGVMQINKADYDNLIMKEAIEKARLAHNQV